MLLAALLGAALLTASSAVERVARGLPVDPGARAAASAAEPGSQLTCLPVLLSRHAISHRVMTKTGLKRALMNPSIIFTAKEQKLMREMSHLANQPVTAARTKKMASLKKQFLGTGK